MSAMRRVDKSTPLPIKVEGDGIRFDIGFEDVLELVEGDRPRVVTVESFPLYPATVGRRAGERMRVHVEILEGDVVIRVRPLQQRLEHHKIFP